MSAPTGASPAASAALVFDPIAVGTDIQRRIGVKTSRDEPLARFTTMRVGGPADLFAVAHNAFELRGLLKFARSRAIPHVVLGRGSNVVISDAGIRGLVIQNRAEGAEIRDDRLVAEAGLPMARAATISQQAGLSGLEFGLAVPGTVGGAVWANAGAHGADVAGVLESAAVLAADGVERRIPVADLGLGYRESRFKTTGTRPSEPVVPATERAPEPARVGPSPEPARVGPAPEPAVVASTVDEYVISATFRLEPAPPDVIKARLDEIKRWRQAHQPLGIPSAGSVFRNPPSGPSAGALIEEAGLKGATEGGATVSPKHANFIVNDRRGTAADVRRLGERVQAIVRRAFGVDLEYEIVFLGDWRAWPAEPSKAPADPVETGADSASGSVAGHTEAGR